MKNLIDALKKVIEIESQKRAFQESFERLMSIEDDSIERLLIDCIIHNDCVFDVISHSLDDIGIDLSKDEIENRFALNNEDEFVNTRENFIKLAELTETWFANDCLDDLI